EMGRQSTSCLRCDGWREKIRKINRCNFRFHSFIRWKPYILLLPAHPPARFSGAPRVPRGAMYVRRTERDCLDHPHARDAKFCAAYPGAAARDGRTPPLDGSAAAAQG